MTRIATFSHYQFTLGQTLDTQRQLLDLQTQISSGKVSTDYVGIADDAQRLINLESAHAQAQQYIDGNAEVSRRLQTMETNISGVFDAATEFRALLVNALNADNGDEMGISQEAANFKQAIANLLNVEQDGRYLFAGSRTATQPVELDGWTPPTMPLAAPLDPYDDEYYKGDQVQLSVQADTSLTVTYGITADADAFEYVLRAMHYVEVGGAPPDEHTLETALGLINAALGTEEPNAALGIDPIKNDLADLRTLVGASRRSIDSANERLDEFTLYTEQNIGDIENVDPAEALARLSSGQAQLQASYMTLTRLSQLSLVNFIK